MLSEVIQLLKDKYHTFSYLWKLMGNKTNQSKVMKVKEGLLGR
jgi:hypothetical protein